MHLTVICGPVYFKLPEVCEIIQSCNAVGLNSVRRLASAQILHPPSSGTDFIPAVENFALILFCCFSGHYLKGSKQTKGSERCLGKASMHLALISSVLKSESEKLDAAIIVF